jgi:ABC-2 type transport system permease protein
MDKVVLIAQHHFLQEARKRSFILLMFALPLFLVATMSIGYLFSRLENRALTLGYVDPAGILADVAPEAIDEPNVRLIPFETAALASSALRDGEIDAYYVLPSTLSARNAQLIYVDPPRYSATRAFENLIRRSVLSDQPELLVDRAISGASITVHAVDRHRDFPSGNPGVGDFLPLIVAAVYAFLVLTTFGYLAEAVVVEKENRTIEVIVTSTSPGRMMTGKIVGGVFIALLQMVVWILCLVFAVWLGSSVLDISWLQDLNLHWRDAWMTVAVALPSYLLIAAITTAIGATMSDAHEVQQLGGFAFVILFLPLYLLVLIIQNPNGPIALAFSFFPLTSVTTIALRSLLMQVPTWQVLVASVLTLACGIFMVWVAGRAFQTSMLRYGRRTHFRELFAMGRRRRTSAAPASGSTRST